MSVGLSGERKEVSLGAVVSLIAVLMVTVSALVAMRPEAPAALRG